MPSVAIIGAGTMGSGIAQVAAQHGWVVQLMDVDAEIARKAVERVRTQLDKLVEKHKLAAADRDRAAESLRVASTPAELAAADLVIEAVVEDLQVKAAVLRPLVAAAGGAVFATNTSSLSVSALGDALGAPQRVVGMHFFNPVPLLPLVEVIAGRASEPSAVQRVFDIATQWGKTAVRVQDTPGFIVNRVARGYYLESLRMLGEGIAGVSEIDGILKRLGGFRMGPFELMDLIGIDVNYSVSVSVWEQLGRPDRLTPHSIQKDLFDRRLFGRKSKQGFYSYQGEHPLPAVPVERRSFDLPPAVYNAVRRFMEKAVTADGSITEQYIVARVVATIMNEAALLVDAGGASADDIDTAMKLGTSYPQGPLEWAGRVGRHTLAGLLRELNGLAPDGRFAPAEWLER